MRRWLAALAVGLVGIAIVGWIAVGPLLSPQFERHVREALAEYFGGQAELQRVEVSLFPTPRVTGDGFLLRHKGRTDIPPLIQVGRFSAITTWRGLLQRPRRVRLIRLEGLSIHIPPRRPGDSPLAESLSGPSEKPEPGRAPGPTAPAARDEGTKSTPVLIERIETPGARLAIAPKEATKAPRLFDIHTLALESVAADRPMRFSATLTNPKPPGPIEASGEFGPFDSDEPADTPLHGKYVFKDADLGVFKGIAGKLTSTGAFKGKLERIEVDGRTSTPDFQVTLAGNPVALETTFSAVVDGTNGNTFLVPVNASFLDTAITARGGVYKLAEENDAAEKARGKEGRPGTGREAAVPEKPGRVDKEQDDQGREVKLDVVIDQARIEDLLRLAVKGSRPIMTGAARVTTTLRIPPGEADVIDKLELDGEFRIASATFSDLDVQRTLAKLSARGRGDVDAEGGGSVVSDLAGRFRLKDGRLTFERLTFAVPGVTVRLSGVYALRAEQLNFRGTLRLQAKVSETVGGFKSVLLKVVDPLFRKNGAGAEIPIKVEGERNKPKFGMDFGALIPGRD